MICRFDHQPITTEFIDLGFSPPSNSFLDESDLLEPELYFPLKLYVSERSFLVQIGEFKKASEIFNKDYLYFSSFSKTWLQHCSDYSDLVTKRFGLNEESRVIEIASNDGYLLQFFQQKGIPVLGIEPTHSTALAARSKNIETIEEFFGIALARKLFKDGIKADLLIGNNVLAHVPDINDFVAGIKIILSETGVLTMEFPHLIQLIEQNQFDTIYHEHFSYFSFYTAQLIFKKHGLIIFDVEEISTHGGSLRIYVKHVTDESQIISDSVKTLLDKEIQKGVNTLAYYKGFQEKADKVKNDFLQSLITLKQKGYKVAAYGAAAKGNTLLNYCGIRKDLISFVSDASPYKQGKFLPGSHIPVKSEQAIRDEKPDFIIILPWNLKNEITEQLQYIREWGGKFIIAIPTLEIF